MQQLQWSRHEPLVGGTEQGCTTSNDISQLIFTMLRRCSGKFSLELNSLSSADHLSIGNCRRGVLAAPVQTTRPLCGWVG
jgi:hypothetical protein